MHLLKLLFGDDSAARWERALIKASLFRRWSAFRRGLSLNAAIFAVRTDIATSKMAKDLDSTPAGVAVDQPNGMRVLFTKLRKTFILISNTSASTRVVTVHKSTAAQDNPSADFLSTAIPVTTGLGILGPFSARYVQADGTIWVDFVAGHTGNIMPFELPS